MANLKIHIDPLSVESSSHGQVTGKLVLEIEDKYFPDKDWNDFVLIVLHWWIEAIKSLKYEDDIFLRFMDGPYGWKLHRQSADIFHVTYVVSDKEIVSNVTLLSSEISKEIYRAASIIVKDCFDKGWGSRELEMLWEELKNQN